MPVRPEIDPQPPPTSKSLGITSGVFAVAGLGLWLGGFRNLVRVEGRNEEAFDGTSLEPGEGLYPETWEHGSCTGPSSSECTDAVAIEGRYPAWAFHADLRRATTIEAAGFAALGTSIGLLPSVLRSHFGRDARTPKIGRLLIVPAVGVVLAGAGGFWLWRAVREYNDGFPTSPADSTIVWRFGTWNDSEQYNILLAAGLTGWGVGMLVGGIVDLGVEVRRPLRVGVGPGTITFIRAF